MWTDPFQYAYRKGVRDLSPCRHELNLLQNQRRYASYAYENHRGNLA
jgi:hypothetical protein